MTISPPTQTYSGLCAEIEYLDELLDDMDCECEKDGPLCERCELEREQGDAVHVANQLLDRGRKGIYI